MFLDYPILIMLYAICIILVLIYVVCHLPDESTNRKNIIEYITFFIMFSVIIYSIVYTVLIYFSVKEPISNKAWKQVYTNNENASVEISFEEGCYQKKYSIKAGENSSDNIRKLYNKLNSDSVVYDVKITVSQGNNKLTDTPFVLLIDSVDSGLSPDFAIKIQQMIHQFVNHNASSNLRILLVSNTYELFQNWDEDKTDIIDAQTFEKVHFSSYEDYVTYCQERTSYEGRIVGTNIYRD